jgi:hypothetical protein
LPAPRLRLAGSRHSSLHPAKEDPAKTRRSAQQKISACAVFWSRIGDPLLDRVRLAAKTYIKIDIEKRN